VLSAELAITVTWQEPITAFLTQRRQDALADQLRLAERDAAHARPALARLEQRRTERERIATLARRFDRNEKVGKPLGRISIPKLDVSFVFVAGTGQKSLTKGPGHYLNTALPGESGTVGIAGHRTTYLAPFRNVDRLRHGDAISLTMPYGRFRYRVEGSRVVAPSNAKPLGRVHHDRLVLTTCTPPFSAAQRLIVFARLRSSAPVGSELAHRTKASHRSNR
jgi:sortase A